MTTSTQGNAPALAVDTPKPAALAVSAPRLMELINRMDLGRSAAPDSPHRAELILLDEEGLPMACSYVDDRILAWFEALLEAAEDEIVPVATACSSCGAHRP